MLHGKLQAQPIGHPPPAREARGGEGSRVGGAAVPQEPREPDRRVARARSLRRSMTDAERKLWWHLRRLPMENGHFRWQATIGRYFADFACHQHRLVIEVDGGGHAEDRQVAADAERTAYLNSRGYRVLRFWNNEVLQQIEGVMLAIYDALCAPAGAAPPTPTPPRHALRARGEGNRIAANRRTSTMPQTLYDKIWQSHLVARRADGRDLIYIDRHIMHDLHTPHALEQLDKAQRPVRRPDLTFVTQDHTVASKPGRDDTTNPEGTPFLRATRAATARHGIRLFDIDDPEQGISHVVAPELGMVLPGATHAVPDSHACTVGGLGVLAFGCGASELEHVLATQVLALKRPRRMRVSAAGMLGPHVTAKDVALRVLAEIGTTGGRGHSIEFAGAAVRGLDIEGRLTLCNLTIEMGARSGLVAPDDTTFQWLAGRPYAPQGAAWEAALGAWRTLASDDGAAF